MSEEFGLKRVLGLGEIVAIEVGTTVGAGVFVLTAEAVKRAGAAVPLAYLCAAVPIVFVMMTVGMLGSAMPTVGGSYRYPSRLFSPGWAMVGVWCYALAMVFGALPMYAVSCVHYLQALFPDCQIPTKLAAIVLLTVFYAVNVFGVELAASVQGLMVAVLLLALAAFGLAGIPQVDPANFSDLMGKGAGGFVIAVCILTFALQGSNSVIELGAEIKNPARNIPLSLLIAIPLVAFLYVLVSVSAVGGMDLGAWMEFGDKANLTQPAQAIMGEKSAMYYFFVIGGALFAFTTTLNGTYLWATKSLMVVAKDGMVPTVLARTSRYGTPTIFLTILWALSSAAVLVDAGMDTFAQYATIGGMIVFIPSMIAAMKLPKMAPELYNRPGFRLRGPLLYIAPSIGVVSSVLLILILFVNLELWSIPFIVWAIIGVPFYVLRRKSVEKKTGVPFSEYVKNDLQSMIEKGLAEQDPPDGND